MNLFRFIRKCLTDRRAAKSSAKLVWNELYGKLYWLFYPDRPLTYSLDSGTFLLLEPKHSFTHCFWPDVDHYEPDVRQILKSFLKEGATFIDCGSNIGYFSVYAGGIVGSQGQVIAIEANPITLEILQRNLKLNKLTPPIHCALGDSIGQTTLYSPEIGDVYSSLNQGGLLKDCNVKEFDVPCQTLDSLIEKMQVKSVDLVKIDVEGAELTVLKGANHLLSSLRPILIVEYGTNTWPAFGTKVQDLYHLLDKYKYSVMQFSISDNHLINISENIWTSAYTNLVLVPQEKVDTI